MGYDRIEETFEEFAAVFEGMGMDENEIRFMYDQQVRREDEREAAYNAWLASCWYPDDSGAPIDPRDRYAVRVYTDAGTLVLTHDENNAGDAASLAGMYRARYRSKLYTVTVWDVHRRCDSNL